MSSAAALKAIPTTITHSLDESWVSLQISMEQTSANAQASALKVTLAAIRNQAREINLIKGGRVAGEFLSDQMDRILRLLLEFSCKKAGLRAGSPGIALLGMGSYGRRDQAPYSDVDVLILHNRPEEARENTGQGDAKLETLISTLLRPLWDAGLTVGHAVRTPAECIAMMEDQEEQDKALETASSLLEARFVTGDFALANLFLKKDLASFFQRRGRPFVEAKFEEAISRHHRLGESIYRTQPNLKESPGGLRDYQLALWIDRASQLSGHLPRLNERPLITEESIAEARTGYDQILTLRTALHSACGRKQEVLDFQMQQTLAKELNFQGTDELQGSELLLRHYFRCGTSVYRLADTVIRRYREERAIASRDIDQIRRRPVDEQYTRIGDFLYFTKDCNLKGPDWLPTAFKAFQHAARQNVSLSQEIIAAIRENFPRMDDAARRDPEAAKIFMDLLQRRSNVTHVMRLMRDVGLLGQYMPEFGELEYLVVNDIFHDYAVDEHTLFLFHYVDLLYATGDRVQRFRRGILERLGRPEILRLACLFHDLGKSRGGAGHSKRGAVMVPQICERLGINQADTRTLIFLVEFHLLLSRTSLRRDTSDVQMIKDLAQKIGSREKLDLLYLLTWADSSAVGSGSFTQWKDELLTELYMRLDEQFTNNGAPSNQTVDLENSLLAMSGSDEETQTVKQHCAKVPRRYLVEVGIADARMHIDLIKNLHACRQNAKPCEAAVSVRAGGELVDIWIASIDHPKRFAQICGAFLGLGVNVISAIAYTRSDGIILDHFRVSYAASLNSSAKPDDAYWQKVGTEIENALSGAADVRTKIENARKKIQIIPQVSRSVEPDVRIDNKISDTYTVVDVICGDRVGLLYGLSRALADLGCDIHFAKVETNQGLATDVFYVTELGVKVLDPEKGHNIRLLLKAVASDFQNSKR
jgi:[protein-PII] uridylyltransferase